MEEDGAAMTPPRAYCGTRGLRLEWEHLAFPDGRGEQHLVPTKSKVRKKRTREHVIADLGVNHVEKHVLRCGHTVERRAYDYGIDLSLYTYDSKGECEKGDIRLQVKATDHLKVSADRRTISIRLDLRDMRHWQEEIMPIILIVYDAVKDKAHWLYIQQFFSKLGKMPPNALQKKIAVSIPLRNVVNETAIRRFVQFRDNLLKQTKGAITHYD
jgi:hypothetical protein